MSTEKSHKRTVAVVLGTVSCRRVPLRLPAVLLGAIVCFVGAGQPAFSGDKQPDPSEQAQIESGASGSDPTIKPAAITGDATGMTVHIDPKTGRFLKKPAPGHVPLQLSPQFQNNLSTSHEGLVEVPSSVPGGGTKIPLQGRFQSPLFITIDPDGKMQMQHLTETPKSDEEKLKRGTVQGGAKDGPQQ